MPSSLRVTSSSLLQLELDGEKARRDCPSTDPRGLDPQPINSTSVLQQRQRRLRLQATLSDNLAYHTSGSKQRWLATIAARSLDHSKDAADAELEVLSWYKGCPFEPATESQKIANREQVNRRTARVTPHRKPFGPHYAPLPERPFRKTPAPAIVYATLGGGGQKKSSKVLIDNPLGGGKKNQARF